MSGKFDINTLTSVNLLNISNFNNYSNYALYVENRNPLDEPIEACHSFRELFDYGFDEVSLNNRISISEKITSKTQFLSKTNYTKITSIFGTVNSTIDYDKMNQLASTLDGCTASEAREKIYEWITEIVDFSKNINPENADDTNLILTHALIKPNASTGKSYVQTIMEAIFNKLFRNLLQLIRVRHDYRLYGTGSTILAGNGFTSTEDMKKFSALPPSCWQEYAGDYIVGKSAYTDELKNVGDTIQNSTFNISPYMCYGVKGHTHAVRMDPSNLKGKVFTYGPFSVVTSITFWKAEKSHYVRGSYPGGKGWKDVLRDWGHIEPGGFLNGNEKQDAIKPGGTFEQERSWGYSWDSKNCYLPYTNDMKSNIYSQSPTTLPTYSTYVWKWIGNDNTTIDNPKQYMSN